MYGIEPPYLFSEKSMKRPEVKVDVKINIAACLWAITFILSILLR
jgi:hypothetical protein